MFWRFSVVPDKEKSGFLFQLGNLRFDAFDAFDFCEYGNIALTRNGAEIAQTISISGTPGQMSFFWPKGILNLPDEGEYVFIKAHRISVLLPEHFQLGDILTLELRRISPDFNLETYLRGFFVQHCAFYESEALGIKFHEVVAANYAQWFNQPVLRFCNKNVVCLGELLDQVPDSESIRKKRLQDEKERGKRLNGVRGFGEVHVQAPSERSLTIKEEVGSRPIKYSVLRRQF